MRVLVLVPHPDDEVVAAAALLDRARRAGHTLFAAYLTEGVPPRDQLWPWDRPRRGSRVAQRWAEAARAAKELGLERVLAEPRPSRTLRLHLAEVHARLRGLVERLEVDALWTPAWEGGHQDHDVTCFLASQLAADPPGGRALQVYELAEYNLAGGRVQTNRFPHLDGTEEVLVLDAEARRRKRELLAIYRSEAANLAHVRVEREVMRPLAAHDYGRPPHEGPLFYQRFAWARWHPRVDGTLPSEVARAIAAAHAGEAGAAVRAVESA